MLDPGHLESEDIAGRCSAQSLAPSPDSGGRIVGRFMEGGAEFARGISEG
jgi:hypothetical protein